MKNGALQILDERNRQVLEEGWTEQHDAEHENGMLTKAAIAYTLAGMYPEDTPGDQSMRETARKYYWPWISKWWKPKDRVRNLVRAGALIAAEIDRLQRSETINSSS